MILYIFSRFGNLLNYSKVKVRVGEVVTIAFLVLKKPISSRWGRKSAKKRYVWSSVFFSGLCLRVCMRSRMLVLKNYSGLDGFTLNFFLGSRNFLFCKVWSKSLLTSRKSIKSVSLKYSLMVKKRLGIL